jgi:hypothetical protein
LFVLFHFFHSIFIIFILFFFSSLSVLLYIYICFLLLIFKKFQFLQKYFDLSIMIILHILSFCLSVKYLCMCLLDLQLGVMIKLFHHISIHLNVVSFRFYFRDFVLQKLQIRLQLWSSHFDKLIIWLFLLLWFFWRHCYC